MLAPCNKMTEPRLVVQNASDKRSFVARQIGGETLLVPVMGTVADLDSIYVLNEVGARIWELLGTATTVEGIAEALAREFAVPPEGAAADVAEFIASLESRGLVRRLAEGE